MITYPFNYYRAKSVADAEAMLARAPEGKLLAGGQTLVAAMRMRLAQPSDLIDISGLKELAFIRRDGNTLVIGAGANHHDVANSAEVAKAIPALAELAESIGDPAVRHRGTLGGSVANNDPAADYPAAVLALAATITTSTRSIAADDFTGMFTTALEENEIVTQVAFPIPERAGYAKFRNPASRYAMKPACSWRRRAAPCASPPRAPRPACSACRRWKPRSRRTLRPTRWRVSSSRRRHEFRPPRLRRIPRPPGDRDGQTRGRGSAEMTTVLFSLQNTQPNIVITRFMRVTHFSSCSKGKMGRPNKPGDDDALGEQEFNHDGR